MNSLRAILTCVDYADLASLTIPYNRHHFTEVMIVTSCSDRKSQDVAIANGCRLHCTGTFHRYGPNTFAKWAALEEALDVYGRHGWLCLMDADILWPRHLPAGFIEGLEVGRLYTPLRHMLTELDFLCRRTIPTPARASLLPAVGTHVDPESSRCSIPLVARLPPEEEWWKYQIHRNIGEWAGYTQIFHASDPVLGNPPWHDVDWLHAGGADSAFQAKWPLIKRVRPEWEVLHLGPACENWYGRVTPYLDGTIPEGKEEKTRALHKASLDRKAKYRNPDRYSHEKAPHTLP